MCDFLSVEFDFANLGHQNHAQAASIEAQDESQIHSTCSLETESFKAFSQAHVS